MYLHLDIIIYFNNLIRYYDALIGIRQMKKSLPCRMLWRMLIQYISYFVHDIETF